MSIQDFFDKWNGKGVDADGYYGFQCMDLAHQFAQDVNNRDFPGEPAAKDVWDHDTPGYDKITNTPDGVPQRGDIIIWGTAIGAYGHIAVFDHGDSNSFVSFDQNWPLNSLCHFQNHNYAGVLGWVRLNSLPLVVQAPAGFVKAIDYSKYVQLNNDPNQIKYNVSGTFYQVDQLNGIITDKAIADKKVSALNITVGVQQGEITKLQEQLNLAQNQAQPAAKTVPTVVPATTLPDPRTSLPPVDFLTALINWLKGK